MNLSEDLFYRSMGLVNLFPGLIVGEILSDKEFCYECHISTDVEYSFGGNDSKFSREKLYTAVRTALNSNEKETQLADRDLKIWKLVIRFEDCAVELFHGDAILRLDLFWPLITSRESRVQRFKDMASARMLNSNEIEKYENLLNHDSISDELAWEVVTDLENTPAFIEEKLNYEFKNNYPSMSTMVPQSLKYYERLIGKYHDSRDIVSYAQQEFRSHLESFEVMALERITILSSHRAISSQIVDLITDDESFQQFASSAIETRAPIALIAILEMGLEKFIESSEKILREVFQTICSADFTVNLGHLNSLIIFVDGELARSKLFRSAPPFYRRLASYTQASLILRAAVESEVDLIDIDAWAREQRGIFFYSQNLIDMRLEPRWLPDYQTPEQLGYELFGRIHHRVQAGEGHPFSKYLEDELTNASAIKFSSFFSGPLEGNLLVGGLGSSLPSSVEEKLKISASAESLLYLAQTSLYWRIDQKYIDSAVAILKEEKYQIHDIENKDSIMSVIKGLSNLASSYRSEEMAEAVFILTRVYRGHIDVNARPDFMLLIGLIAAAAYENLEEWADYIARWFTDLAYLSMEKNTIVLFTTYLEHLCVLEPYLNSTCGKALAIFRSLADD